MILLYLSGGLMAFTAVAHSALGERGLIRPVLALKTGVMAKPGAQRVLRLAWHLTSALMVACAVAVVWPGTPRAVLGAVGLAWLIPGVVDAVYTRGRHVGWPLLTAAGALPLLYLAL